MVDGQGRGFCLSVGLNRPARRQDTHASAFGNGAVKTCERIEVHGAVVCARVILARRAVCLRDVVCLNQLLFPSGDTGAVSPHMVTRVVARVVHRAAARRRQPVVTRRWRTVMRPGATRTNMGGPRVHGRGQRACIGLDRHLAWRLDADADAALAAQVIQGADWLEVDGAEACVPCHPHHAVVRVCLADHAHVAGRQAVLVSLDDRPSVIVAGGA